MATPAIKNPSLDSGEKKNEGNALELGRVTELVEKAIPGSRDALKTGREYATKARDGITRLAKERPVETVLAGLGLGFLLGGLLRRH